MALIVDDSRSVSRASAKSKPAPKKPSAEQTKSWENAYSAADAGSLGLSSKPAPQAAPPKPLGAPGPYEAADAGSLGIPYKPVISHAQVGKGSAGGEIRDIQIKLDALGYDVGGADGVFGPKTEAAVLEFQAKNNLDVDGVIGPQTHRALDNIQNPWEAIDAGSLDPLVRSTPSRGTNDYAAADAGSLGVTENPYGAADAGSLGLTPGQTFDPGPGTRNPSNFEQVLDPLNSTGDQVDVNLSAHVGVTGKVLHGGVEGQLSASVEQTDDGYVIKVDREAALRLGLEIDGKKNGNGGDASVTGGVGGGVLIKYHFDTKEEAAQGLKDLTLTAGDDPRAGHVAAGAENAADVAHGAASVYDAVSDRALGFLTGGLIDNNPVGDVVESATGAVEGKTNEARAAIDSARSRLNAARDGTEFSVFVDGKLDGKTAAQIGLPAGLDVADLNLAGGLSGKTEFTVDVDRSGDVSLSVSQNRAVNGSASGGGIAASGNAAASIDYELEFKRNGDGRLVRQNGGEITFNFNAEGEGSRGIARASAGGGFSYTVQADDLRGHAGQAVQQALDGNQEGALEALASVPGELKLNVEVGAGAGIDGDIKISNVTASAGIDRTYGTEATFTVDARNGLNGDVRAAAGHIVNGDIDQGLDIIGNIEGDLTVQSQRQTSGNLGFEVDTRAVDVSVTGTATATDRDEALNVEGVTLRDGVLIATGETRDFAAQEADAATQDIETVRDGIDDVIDERLPFS